MLSLWWHAIKTGAASLARHKIRSGYKLKCLNVVERRLVGRRCVGVSSACCTGNERTWVEHLWLRRVRHFEADRYNTHTHIYWIALSNLMMSSSVECVLKYHLMQCRRDQQIFIVTHIYNSDRTGSDSAWKLARPDPTWNTVLRNVSDFYSATKCKYDNVSDPLFEHGWKEIINYNGTQPVLTFDSVNTSPKSSSVI